MRQLTYELICRYPNARILHRDILHTLYKVDKVNALVDLLDPELVIYRSRVISDCQLVLRTKEQMTDDEYSVIGKIASRHSNKDFTKIGKSIMSEKEYFWCDMSDGEGRLAADDILSYLRKQNISTEPNGTEGTYWVKEINQAG